MADDLLTVRLRLQGARQFVGDAAASAAGLAGFGVAAEETAAKTKLANLESRALAQGWYTLRRYAFYGTAALLGGAAAALKLGFSFDEAKRQGTQAFTAILGGAALANREMSTLTGLTHQTGLQLTTLTGFAETMQGFGFSIGDVNKNLGVLANFSERSGASLSSLVEVYDRIRQSGKLTSLDLRTLTMQGIPALAILTRQLHLSAVQAAQLRAGKLIIPSSFALPALTSGVSQRASQLGTGLGQQVGIAHSYLSSLLGGGETGIFSFATRGLERLNAAFGAGGGSRGFFTSLDPSGKLLTDWRALTTLAGGVAGGFRMVWHFAVPIVGLFTSIVSTTGSVLKQTGLLGVSLTGVARILKTLTALYIIDRTRLLAVWAAQKLTGDATLFTTGALEKQTIATTGASDAAIGLRGSLLGLKAMSPLSLLILASLVPKAKPSANPNAPSNNPVAKWFGNLPGIGGVFSQTNRLGDWLDNQLGLAPSPSGAAPLRRATVTPTRPSGITPATWSRMGIPPEHQTVELHVDGDKIAETTVKTSNRRKVIANAVVQAQDSVAGRG